MLLNDDLSIRTLVHAGEMEWAASPMAGVERLMLFRVGDEQARATSIVRYAPGSRFSRHRHPGGEEILVLDGVFQDESGDFPAGSYIRNPPGTGHTPGSEDGCTILVKLWQFSAADGERIIRRPGKGEEAPHRHGVRSARILFEGAAEHVVMEWWDADADIVLANPVGLELLVLDGSFISEEDSLHPMSWLRLPAGMSFRARTGSDGATIWYKSAPLLHDDVCGFGYAAFDPAI